MFLHGYENGWGKSTRPKKNHEFPDASGLHDDDPGMQQTLNTSFLNMFLVDLFVFSLYHADSVFEYNECVIVLVSWHQTIIKNEMTVQRQKPHKS